MWDVELFYWVKGKGLKTLFDTVLFFIHGVEIRNREG